MIASPGFSRRDFVKLSALCAASATLGASFVGCTSDPQFTGPRPISDVRTLSVALNKRAEPRSGFDPLFGWGCAEFPFAPLIQSTLFQVNQAGEVEPDLVRSQTISEDGLVWTLQIRDGVVFSDETSLTAKDVCFSLTRAIESPSVKCDLSMISEVELIDETTLMLRLNRPSLSLGYSLAFIGIIPAHSYDENTYGDHPIGSGLYSLSSWERGSEATFSYNPHYYGTEPTFKTIHVYFEDEDGACARCYEGTVDLAFTSNRLTSQSIDEYNLADIPATHVFGVSLPLGDRRVIDGVAWGNNITSEKIVRQALNTGINRTNLLSNAVGGYGSPSASLALRLPWADARELPQIDTARACTMLEEAGWEKDATGVYTFKDMRAEMNLYFEQRDDVLYPPAKTLAQEFAKQAHEIGFEITPVGVSREELIMRASSELCMMEWGALSPLEVYETYASNGELNHVEFQSAEVDERLSSAESAQSFEELCEGYARALNVASGPGAQHEAAYVMIGAIDHLYFKRNQLDIGDFPVQGADSDWGILAYVGTWYFDDPESA